MEGRALIDQAETRVDLQESPSTTSMKPRLHIPMKTNQTTRQHRRVVWIIAQVLLSLGLLFGGSRLFLLRSSLLAMAPENTDLAFTHLGLEPPKRGREGDQDSSQSTLF